ncbi:MAG: hypothetical protein OXH15_09905 [Gammaproteobacteria bacterium]|nr:hypothetical protein [Gammaproteobacteria bacterium]
MQPRPDDPPISGASYLIPVDNVPALVRHANGLLARARKADVDWALECRIEPQPQVLRDGDLLQWVTVLVRPPRTAGWSLAARYDIDPFGMAATIPHSVPGVELPRRYWTVGDPVCEHCNTVRDRRAVFLLSHADGRHKLVGRSCLRSFLDHPDPERIAALFDALVPDGIVARHLFRDPGSPDHGGGYLDAAEELAWTAAIVARYGWRSVAKANDEHTATASRLAFLMNRPHPKLASLWHAERAACAPTDEHRATARHTVELVRAAPADSEYLVKLKALADAAAVHVRDRALWCSAITLHIRRRAKQREREAAASAPPIEPGRQVVEGRIVKLDLRDYRNFVREVMTVQDAHGRKFWGTQPRFLYEAKEGDPVAFRADVEPSRDNPAFAFFKRPTRVPKAA